jgi:importin subunit alpha-1
MIDACWALSYISDGNNDNIQAVLDCGCASRMVSLLNHPSYKVQVPALRTVGNIITGSEKQTQVLLDLNVLPLLYRLLQSPRKGTEMDYTQFSNFQDYARNRVGQFPILLQDLVNILNL